MKREVKDIVYAGLHIGYSTNQIIGSIMFEIADEEELKLMEYTWDMPELYKRAEKLYNQYKKEYYKQIT